MKRALPMSAWAALIAVLTITSANAQTASSTGANGAPTLPATKRPGSIHAGTEATLNEVVVTAERRKGTVQSTPFSVTAYSGAQLVEQGIPDMTALAYETAGVSVKNGGPGQTEYEIRGVAATGGTFPTTGFYLDDIPLTAPASAIAGKVVIDPNLYDLNRVEVLRGPQGTLYGAGSMGGTIKLVTNQPDPSALSASVQGIGSDTQNGGFNYAGSMMANVPLVQDTLALRVVATDQYNSGWIDRIVLNPFPPEANDGNTRGNVLAAPVEDDFKGVNWERLEGERASVLWQPTSQLSITPMVFHQTITQGGLDLVDNPPGTNFEAHYQPFNEPESISDSFTIVSLPIKLDFDDFQVSSTTARYTREANWNQDTSEIVDDFFEAVIGIPDLPYAQVGPVGAFENDTTSQFTQEVRVTSTGTSPFQWLVGGFYENYSSGDFLGTTPPGPIVQAVLGAPSLFEVITDSYLKQYAGFGEVSYKFANNFKATAGLRYYSYNSGQNLIYWGGLVTGTGAAGATARPPANATVVGLSSSSDGVNPKFNLSYEPNDDLTLYVQAAKGFRPGGGNGPPPITCTSWPTQFDPDSLWSYEVGEKARPFSGQLTVNAAAYFEDWTDIQQTVAEPCGATYTGNAGTAHVDGGELEASLNLTPKLTIATSTGYTHAYIVEALQGSGFFVGERVQNVPDWTTTTSILYRQPVSDNNVLVLRATDVYVGTMTDVAYTTISLPVRNIVNLRATLNNSSNLSATLFVDNATDKRAYLSDVSEISFEVAALNRIVTNQPRTIGLELDYKFGGK